jgi:hypothetical protein
VAGGLWFGGFEFDRSAFHEEERVHRLVEKAYFRFLYRVMLANSSGMADLSFRPAFR